jgi:hypothetical protein
MKMIIGNSLVPETVDLVLDSLGEDDFGPSGVRAMLGCRHKQRWPLF